MTTIGSRIRAARRRMGLNQKKFSELAGISQGYLSDVERDKTKPSAEILIGIAEQDPFTNLNWVLTGAGEIERERTEYIGGEMTRRVTILDAIFSYMHRYFPPDEDDIEFKSHSYAVIFYRISALSMVELENAYDSGTTDIEKLIRLIRSIHLGVDHPHYARRI